MAVARRAVVAFHRYRPTGSRAARPARWTPTARATRSTAWGRCRSPQISEPSPLARAPGASERLAHRPASNRTIPPARTLRRRSTHTRSPAPHREPQAGHSHHHGTKDPQGKTAVAAGVRGPSRVRGARVLDSRVDARGGCPGQLALRDSRTLRPQWCVRAESAGAGTVLLVVV